MKKFVFVLGLLFSPFVVYTQSVTNNIEKPLKFGFNLGINQSNVLDNGNLPNNASLSNNLGFRLGILADYKVAKIFLISPKAELSYNNCQIDFTNSDGSKSQYEVMPKSLDLMSHFVFKKNNEKSSPYFLFGPNVKIPISKRPKDQSSYSTSADFAIDFGIGIERAFANFNFSPELRYSFGLRNVNQNPMIQSLKFHNISLVLNFIE
ncbi:MAG: PorT family protein [Bacteroidetes bacterium]|nr:PorT family protein [Bacteroidota bacterium]